MKQFSGMPKVTVFYNTDGDGYANKNKNPITVPNKQTTEQLDSIYSK